MEKKSIWTNALTVVELNRRCENTLSSHLGIEFIEVGDDFLTARMPIDRRTMQPMGILHGGASCVLAETVGSAAANYCIDQTHQVGVGLEININHIRSVNNGYVTGITRPLQIGKSIHVWEIKIYDDEKRLTAASRLTLAILQRRTPN